jgi:hypothetical protein
LTLEQLVELPKGARVRLNMQPEDEGYSYGTIGDHVAGGATIIWDDEQSTSSIIYQTKAWETFVMDLDTFEDNV